MIWGLFDEDFKILIFFYFFCENLAGHSFVLCKVECLSQSAITTLVYYLQGSQGTCPYSGVSYGASLG